MMVKIKKIFNDVKKYLSEKNDEKYLRTQ